MVREVPRNNVDTSSAIRIVTTAKSTVKCSYNATGTIEVENNGYVPFMYFHDMKIITYLASLFLMSSWFLEGKFPLFHDERFSVELMPELLDPCTLDRDSLQLVDLCPKESIRNYTTLTITVSVFCKGW